jgi:CRISPR-associated protein Csb2
VVTAVRRAIVTVYNGAEGDDLHRPARLLSGEDLIAEQTGNPAAILSRINYRDATLDRYTRAAADWATVTPVVLPGHDDPRKIRRRFLPPATGDRPDPRNALVRLDQRIDHLLRKAIRQAGYGDELARHSELEWRSVGFWPGTDHARNYAFPAKLRRFRRLHVRISWRDASGSPVPVPGPICLGGGRFVGLGLFAVYG